MGLDSVELLVDVEKTFDIEIPDSEAVKIATVGDFYEAVWDKIKDKKSDKCSSAMLFYRFRQFLLSKYDFPYKDFKPNTNLNDLIPKDIRKAKWKVIQQDFDYQLPDLELPYSLRRFLNYFGFSIVLGALIYAIIAVNFFDATKLSFMLPIVGLFLIIGISIILRPLRTDFGEKNVREFIDTVLTLNYKKIRLTFGANRTEMEKIMNNLIHDKSGVDYEEIKPEAYIVNDLGIN
jgi:acyl carrier protein